MRRVAWMKKRMEEKKWRGVYTWRTKKDGLWTLGLDPWPSQPVRDWFPLSQLQLILKGFHQTLSSYARIRICNLHNLNQIKSGDAKSFWLDQLAWHLAQGFSDSARPLLHRNLEVSRVSHDSSSRHWHMLRDNRNEELQEVQSTQKLHRVSHRLNGARGYK